MNLRRAILSKPFAMLAMVFTPAHLLLERQRLAEVAASFGEASTHPSITVRELVRGLWSGVRYCASTSREPTCLGPYTSLDRPPRQ